MRYLAVDVGNKRTGLALGDSETGIVSPSGLIEAPMANREGVLLIEAIGRASDEHLGIDPRREPGELVLGLPLNMDGTEGHQAKLVRALGARVAARTRRVVHYQDERLTSVEADWSMAQSGMTHGQKKQRRDSLAAAAFLRDFLAAKSVGTQDGPDDE